MPEKAQASPNMAERILRGKVRDQRARESLESGRKGQARV